MTLKWLWPFIAVTKPHDIECDSCHEQNASVLVAASNKSKLRLCHACAKDVRNQLNEKVKDDQHEARIT